MPDVIMCPQCRQRTMYRRPGMSPEWYCSYCDGYAETEEIPDEILEEWGRGNDER